MPSKNVCVNLQAADQLISLDGHDKDIDGLMALLSRTLNLREIWYFGLQYEADGIPKFARLKKKVSYYKMPGSNTVNFRLRVRYYPQDVSEIIEDITRYYFFFEAREMVVGGKIHCPRPAALYLASYHALIRHGPYNPEIYTSENFNLANFLPEYVREVHKLSDEEWIQKIAELHKNHGDIAREDAVYEYLKIAQELDMYGIAYHPVKNKKGTKLHLGISAFGISIYNEDNQITPVIGFSWGEIKTLSYSGTKITFKPTANDVSALVCQCESSANLKEIKDTCVGYCRRVFGTKRDTVEVQQMKVSAKQAQEARQAERERRAAERLARENAEKRLLEVESALKERQHAFEQAQAALTDYQQRLKELEEKFEMENKTRLDLQAMQRHLEEVNETLQRENLASSEERKKLQQEKAIVEIEIGRQTELLEQQKAEKLKLEELVRQAKETQAMEANGKKSPDEREVNFPEGAGESIPEAKMTSDEDYVQQMNKVANELEAVKDVSKLSKQDQIYEENMKKGMDKFRTLRQIRQGNTKKRVELFECL